MVSKIDTAWNLFLEGKISEAKQLVEQDFSIDTCTDFSLLNLMGYLLLEEKAHYFIQEWLHSEIDLLNFTKGYLKEKVRFYSDSHFSKPLRSWEKFLGHSKPVSIIISKPKTELEQKLEWFTYKGSGAILKAYKFLYDNNLLHEYEKSNYLALNNMEYPPDLASGLIERAILFKREDLIPTIKENIKRRN